MDARVDAAPALASRRYGAVNWLGLRTLVSREIQRFMKVAAQTVVAPLVSTILFMMVFALAFGDRPWGATSRPYIDGLAAGLVMMAVISNAFQNASSSLIIAKVQGNAVDFLMPPLSALELTISFIAGAAARGMLVGFVSLVAVGAVASDFAQSPDFGLAALTALGLAAAAFGWTLFGKAGTFGLAARRAVFAGVGVLALIAAAHSDLLRPANAVAVVYFALAASVIFGAIGLIGGIWADKFDHLAAVTNFIVTPLTFLSGTFYSVDALPEPFRTISHWNPVFFLIDGFRYGFIGHHDAPLMTSVLWSGGVAVLLCWVSWALIRSGWRLRA